MHTFTDTQGRVWTIAITVDAVKRVRALTGTDLLAVAGGDLLERLSTDPVLLADVLYAVVRPEADARQVSDADFGRALAGDVIGAATTALLEDIVDFFPGQKRRLLATALQKLHAVQDAAMAVAQERVEALDATALVSAATAEPPNLPGPHGPSSGASPASSAATPAA
jgi:hypothetical protein